MTAPDARTAAQTEADARDMVMQDAVMFVDGAEWGAAYVTPTREQIAEAIHDSLPDDMNGRCYQWFGRCIPNDGPCVQVADAVLELIERCKV